MANYRHPSSAVQAALVRLLDELCTWERETGRRSVLILSEPASQFHLQAQEGKPVEPGTADDAQLLRSVLWE